VSGDWASLIGPAVVAALIAAIVSIIGFVLNRATVRAMHAERLAFDREQAQRRTEAEIALAEKKAAFDKALVLWRRRYELAEQILPIVYEARDALKFARTRVIMKGEGESRGPEEPENEKLRDTRNSYFVPVERLAKNARPFADLGTLRYASISHFGPESGAAIDAILEVHGHITNTASVLIELAEAEVEMSNVGARDFRRQQIDPLRWVLWGAGERPDEIDRKLADAIARLEATYRPALLERPPG
jgi:hypothetical protein